MIFKGNSGGIEPTNFFKPVVSLFSQTAGLNDDQKNFYNDLIEAHKKYKDQTDKLSGALEKLKEDYKGADLGISSYINSVGDGTITAEGFTKSINNNTRALLKNKLMAAAVNIGISALASFVIGVAVKAWQEYSQRAQRAADATKEFVESTKTINDSFDQYDELYKVLSDSTSTTEELNDAKAKLLDIQNQLSETYGKEAEGIDLVNGKYEEQISLLEKVRSKEIEKYLRENRVELEALSKEMNKEFQFGLGNVGTALYDEEFAAALNNLYSSSDVLSLNVDGRSNATAYFSDDVKDAYDSLSSLYDQFSEIRDLATSDVERTFIDNVLNNISRKISEWNEKYADKAEAYNTYSSAVMYSVPNLTTEDGNAVSVSRTYEEYIKAVDEYNKKLTEGTRAEIDAATAKLESAKAAAEGVVDLASSSDSVTSQQSEAIADGFDNITASIDSALAKRQELKFALQDLADEDISTPNSITDDNGNTLLTDKFVQRIKRLKMTMAEFNALLNSDNGKIYFNSLDSVATKFGVTLEDILELLSQLGIFSDLETPMSDEDLELYVKYKDLIHDVVSGEKKYVFLTDEEKSAIDRWNQSAFTRNSTLENYLKLCDDVYAQDAADHVNRLADANDNLVLSSEQAASALKDIDTITDVVNGDMYLTDKQMLDLISRHSDLQSELRYTTKGWFLEKDAMDVVENAARSLEGSYISAQQSMTDLCSSAVGQRIKMYGIELKSLKSIMTAFSTGSNGLAKMTMASSVYNTEQGKAFADEVLAAGNNLVISSDNTADKIAESWAVINAREWLKVIDDAEKYLNEAAAAQEKVAKKSSTKDIEKYTAEINKLYKALEKQKEIEEDIADIKRKRDALEDDDFSGRIKYTYQEIEATKKLNDVLHEQNEIRRSLIRANIEKLQKYGFSVSYDAPYNELLIDNYKDLNELATSYAKKLGYGAEKTNEFVKAVEKLIEDTHEFNDANKENSATWQDNTQAVKDYIKEIKNLKTEMVDTYLDKRNNYLSHMQDFELFDEFQSSEYLNGMLNDLKDFYNAGLIDYEEYVKRHNEITKQLYDSRKDSLESILGMIEDMIRQELEDQVDALEDQKDALSDIIDMKKELISLAKEENDYNKSLKDKVKEMAKLQERIAQLELDDSREAAAEKASLIDQLADLQSEVDEMQHDKSIELQESALDEMQDANEKALDKQIEKIEDVANDAGKIHEMVVDKITNDWDTLYHELVDWNSIYGTGVEADVKGAWDNAIESLKVYKEHLGQITTAQAALGTVDPLLPNNSGSAGSVIADANKAEISNIVDKMKEYASRWSRNNEDSVNKALENAAFQESLKLPALGVVAERDPKTGKWIIQRDDNDPTNVGKVLYDVYHQGGTVGARKDSEVFSLLEKGEDVLTKKQKFTAIPILKAGLQALNINENTAKILEALQNGARPSLAAMNNSEPSVVFNPEISIEVNAGNNSKEIAAATKDAVWSAITEPFSKMGVSSKLRSIKV